MPVALRIVLIVSSILMLIYVEKGEKEQSTNRTYNFLDYIWSISYIDKFNYKSFIYLLIF